MNIIRERKKGWRVSYKFPTKLNISSRRHKREATWRRQSTHWKMKNYSFTSCTITLPRLDLNVVEKWMSRKRGRAGVRRVGVRIDIFINSKNHFYIFYLPQKAPAPFLHKHLFVMQKRKSRARGISSTTPEKKQVEQTREIKANLIEWLGWFPFIIFRTKGKQESREKEKRENENVFPISKEKEIARESSQDLKAFFYHSRVKFDSHHPHPPEGLISFCCEECPISFFLTICSKRWTQSKAKEIEDFSDFLDKFFNRKWGRKLWALWETKTLKSSLVFFL